MGTEIDIVRDHVPDTWGGAAQRGLEARQQREAIVAQVLKPGIEADYGIIPGTKKATLLKPGAEKIADSLNLYPDYEQLIGVEDFDRPLFHYKYRCSLKARGSDVTVATGIGSCNSMEARYRWREGKRSCPKCKAEAIIKGKEEYGGGWLCYAKKGGCGAKFSDGDQTIEGQSTAQGPNDDIFSSINAIDKIAQKRAMIAATLNLGFSEQFTQDLDDGVIETEVVMPKPVAAQRQAAPPQKAAQPPPKQPPAPVPEGFGFVSDIMWRGVIEDVNVSEGTSAKGPWKRFDIIGTGNQKFQTFSESFGKLAADFMASGGICEIFYQKKVNGKYTNYEVTNIQALAGDEPPNPAEAEDIPV